MEKNNDFKKEDKKIETIKEENIIQKDANKKHSKEIANSNIIKKPAMTQEEYEIMMKKRNLMKKSSKYRPMTLLFGKHKKTPVQNQNNHTLTISCPNLNNTNIQINNYTTFLTSIETITEEKYQKDGKTLIVENPNYSMKQLNYKYQTNQLNKIMIIYIRKINELEDIYNFTNEYLSFIINIFGKLCKPFISSLNGMFSNNIKSNLKYFKEISSIFFEFSEKFKFMQNQLLLQEKLNNKQSNDKANSMTYLNCNLNDSVKTINNLIVDNFNNTSKNIQNLILNNPLYLKIDTVEIKFTNIFNKMEFYINKLIHRQNKFSLKYKKDFFPFFAGIKQKLNDSSLYQFLTTGKDFIFIEQDIIFYTNKIYNKISQFLINMEFLFKDSQNTFFDYLELLTNIIKLYYKENKNILDISSLLPNKSILNLDNLLKVKDIRESIEKKYSFNKIIENSNDEKLFNDLNHFLLNYRDLLLQYTFVKNDDIEEVINFNLINYNSPSNFVQFLMKLIPSKFLYKFKDIIQLKMNVKRNNNGIIRTWKNSLLVITFQGHIFIFDKEGGEIGRKEIINSIIEEDESKNNKKEKNENEDLYEVIKNNKLITNYWRNNLGVIRLASKDNQRLIEFYENYMGFRQYRPIIIDALNDNNLNELINVLSNNQSI